MRETVSALVRGGGCVIRRSGAFGGLVSFGGFRVSDSSCRLVVVRFGTLKLVALDGGGGGAGGAAAC